MTTPETCRCECEECLALRAAEEDPGCGATVAAFEHDGGTYEIDHLVGSGGQWGEFAVYCDGEEVAEFAVAGPVRRPGSRPAALPACADELVRLARQALSGRAGMIRPAAGRPARSRHARVRSPGRCARPGPGAVARHVAASGSQHAGSRPSTARGPSCSRPIAGPARKPVSGQVSSPRWRKKTRRLISAA